MDFSQQLSTMKVLQNEPMARHTTFKVGGPADWMAFPQSEEDIVRALQAAKEAGMPVTVIGNGSNLIVRDGGIRGLVIKIGRNLSEISVDQHNVIAQGGATLRKVANFALEHSLSGFEFAAGIPGNVGGAACMNAGAYGCEMAKVIHNVQAVTREGEIRCASVQELDFGYRQSKIRNEGWIVTRVFYNLSPDDAAEIRKRMEEYDARRSASQPLDYPSAGSVFKRPEGHYAGKLVQDSGLKGYAIGGAQVSPKHAGFIINTGAATAQNIEDLIQHIQKTVWDQFGVSLETEVRMIGETT